MTDNKPVSKAFILAGGIGSRLAEQTHTVPKPLVKICDEPVILSVMRRYYEAGVRDIYLLCGYKVEEFKKFFHGYMTQSGNMVYTQYGARNLDSKQFVEDWCVNVIDTGLDASTGQRVNAIRDYVEPGESFFLTYGDSVSDIDVRAVEVAHRNSTRDNTVTVTAVPVTERFGVLKTAEDGNVEVFAEKSDNKEQLINGGYMVCDHSLLNYVNDSTGDLSFEILTQVTNDGKMGFYRHNGFWHAMDTQRDVEELTKLKTENPSLF